MNPLEALLRLKSRLRSGEPTYGAILQLASPAAAALIASQGFDWIWIDTEHGAISVETAQLMIQASQGTDAVPLVRIPENVHWLAKAHLDAGAMGVITPMVNSAKEAQDAVGALRYPPLGVRGFGPAMATARWGVKDALDYASIANNEVLSIMQIEHADAINAIDEIVCVPGIDIVFVGLYDLSASLGLMGEIDHPDVVAAARRVLMSAQRAGVAAGVIALGVDAARRWENEGFQFIAVTTDTVLLSGGSHELLSELSRKSCD